MRGKRGTWMTGCVCGRMVPGRRGHARQGEHARFGVGGLCVAGEMATEASGTHPTGMHSCCSRDFTYRDGKPGCTQI